LLRAKPPTRGWGSGSPGEVFEAFLKLGLTSFGGPIAHLGYFRNEFVVRRKWLDEAAYADLNGRSPLWLYAEAVLVYI
jgi:chromate transporter